MCLCTKKDRLRREWLLLLNQCIAGESFASSTYCIKICHTRYTKHVFLECNQLHLPHASIISILAYWFSAFQFAFIMPLIMSQGSHGSTPLVSVRSHPFRCAPKVDWIPGACHFGCQVRSTRDNICTYRDITSIELNNETFCISELLFILCSAFMHCFFTFLRKTTPIFLPCFVLSSSCPQVELEHTHIAAEPQLHDLSLAVNTNRWTGEIPSTHHDK